MKTYIKIIIALIAIALCTTACFDDLNRPSIDPNKQSDINNDELFVKIYATLALTGQQGPDGQGDIAGIDEGNSSFYRMIYGLNEFPADQIYWIWPDAGVDDIRQAKWNASNALCKGLFARLYFDIVLCNLYLENTAGDNSASTKTKRAEVRFVRALNYYYLLDFFGNVAFVDKISSKNPEKIMRPALYDWLVTELNALEPDLADAGNRVSYYRVDKAAAWLLLSRIYLNAQVYTGTADWNNAAIFSKKVIDSSYQLASQYQYLFMGDNDNISAVNDAYKEIILPIGQDGQMTRSWGVSMFLIASTHTDGLASWGITESWKCNRSRYELVKLFFPSAAKYDDINNAFLQGDTPDITAAAQDDRALFCNYRVNGTDIYRCLLGRKDNVDEFKSGWTITKFTNLIADPNRRPSDTMHPDADIPFMRKAEAYLTYAEAVLRGATELGGLTADQAVFEIRDRANATPKTGVTLQDILDERGREFYSEGYRRTDLIRFNKFGGANQYYWEYKGGTILGKDFEAWRNLYPIPQSDIVANPNLKPNNEGYN
jgi:hypothetical protein